MLGEAEVGELTLQNEAGESEDEKQATADHVKQLIEDCKKLLISEPCNVVGAWGLIDADPGYDQKKRPLYYHSMIIFTNILMILKFRFVEPVILWRPKWTAF